MDWDGTVFTARDLRDLYMELAAPPQWVTFADLLDTQPSISFFDLETAVGHAREAWPSSFQSTESALRFT